VSSENQEARFK